MGCCPPVALKLELVGYSDGFTNDVSLNGALQNKPLYVGVDDGRSVSTREGLEQGYCVVPGDKRFLLLFTFLKKNMNKKVCNKWINT